MNRFLSATALVVLSFVWVGQAGATVLFSDDFTGGPSAAWGNQRGNWATVGGQYYAQAPNNSPPTYSDVTTLPGLTDFAVDVDVNNFVDGGIWLRSNYGGGNISGVVLVTGGLGHTGGGLYWHTANNGNFSGLLGSTGDIGLRGENVHLHIVVSGASYSVFVNGSGTAATTLTDNSVASGSAGLYDFTGDQYFDNFQISSLDAVPEPSAAALLALSLIGIAGLKRAGRPARY